MAATLQNLEYLGSSVWRASATSDEGSPVYRWYYRGDLIREEETGEIDFRAYGSEVPHLEVFDDESEPDQQLQPGRLELRWYYPPDGSAIRFDIERESAPDSGSWSIVSRMAQDGRGHYIYRTDWLDDLTTYSHRIRVTDEAGNQTTTIMPDAQIVRHPTVPLWTATRGSGGALTLEAV